MLKRLIFVAFLPLLASCASLSEDACRQGDWASIGLRDGVNGQLESYINNHREACSEFGITPDVQTWLRYRAEGLKEYCTAENAYRIGRSGRDLNPVCEGNRDALRLANFYGQRYYEIESQIDDLEDMEDVILTRLATEFTGELTPEQVELQQFLLADLREIRRDIRRLERELRKYDDLP